MGRRRAYNARWDRNHAVSPAIEACWDPGDSLLSAAKATWLFSCALTACTSRYLFTDSSSSEVRPNLFVRGCGGGWFQG